MYPKIYLTVDNCFAYKRWTEPKSWAKVISEMGIYCVEASADTELDPLYMGEKYLKQWVEDVRQAEEQYGVRVANLYSGHGTYSTLGLTHTDGGVQKRIIEDWFKPMIKTAASLGAGMGFFAHGFSESVMQDKVRYERYVEKLYESLSKLCAYGAKCGCGKLSVEQMYVPYMIPWTIEGTKMLLKEVKKRSGADFYFTEDTGHHHTRFVMPTKEQIKEAFESKSEIWLGADETRAIYDAAYAKDVLTEKELDRITCSMSENLRFFSKKEDSDCYEWLRQIGCFSPIIHLQQTSGKESQHKPFTKEENGKGIIEGKKLIAALKESYDRQQDDGMPQKCDEIHLTMELFSSTTQYTHEILENYQITVDYWREIVPKDGMRLNEIID